MHTSTHLQPRLFLLALVRTPFTRARVYASISLYTNAGLYPFQRLKNHGLLRFCSRTFSRAIDFRLETGGRISARKKKGKVIFKYKLGENFDRLMDVSFSVSSSNVGIHRSILTMP